MVGAKNGRRVPEVKTHHLGITIHQQYKLPQPNVAGCPRPPLILGHNLLHGFPIELVLLLDADLLPRMQQLMFRQQPQQLILNPIAKIKTVVHITRLLEPASPDKSSLSVLRFRSVRRARTPAYIVGSIILLPRSRELRGNDLHAVFVDEDARRAANALIMLDRLPHRRDGRNNDITQPFLEDRHLDRDMRILDASIPSRVWRHGTVVSAVPLDIGDRPDELEQAGDEGGGEEEREDGGEGDHQQVQEAQVGAVDEDLAD